MILEAHNLTFYYRNCKKNPIIDRFELTLSPGERVGLRDQAAGERRRFAGCWQDMNARSRGKYFWTAGRSGNTEAFVRYRWCGSTLRR